MNWRFWRRKTRKRAFDAAKINRLLNDWVTSSNSMDADIKSGLSVLRARSRDLCQNNDYGRRFLWLLASNVVGSAGIRMQAKTGDKAVDDELERGWQNWSKYWNTTTDRRMGFNDLCRLAIQTVARDGEFIIVKKPGYNNAHRFALQVVEPDYLDHEYSDKNKNIKMGVEMNRYRAPRAYHFLTSNPAGMSAYIQGGKLRKRVPARLVEHLYIIDRAEQTRGYPWTATALKRLQMLGRYEEAEVVAARVGAAQMGFFTSPDGMGLPGDDKDDGGNLISEVSPGKFEQLPQGYDFKAFSPEHPTTAFDDFVKAILRGAASGLNVSYASLSNNLRDVNYSSLRHGAIEERDIYMMLQEWLVDHLCWPVYLSWLPMALSSGALDLPLADIDIYKKIRWQPRRWQWVDPSKDVKAQAESVALKIKSRKQIILEQGNDPQEVFDQLETESAMFPEETTQGAKNHEQDNQNRQDLQKLRTIA